MILTPCLTRVAQQAVGTLTPEEAADYDRVKAMILGSLCVSTEMYRKRLWELWLERRGEPKVVGQPH